MRKNEKMLDNLREKAPPRRIRRRSGYDPNMNREHVIGLRLEIHKWL